MIVPVPAAPSATSAACWPRLGRIDEGLDYLDRAIAVLTEVGARMDVAWCRGEKGLAHAGAGRMSDAEREWLAADREYELIDRPVARAELLRSIAEVVGGEAAVRYRERAAALER